MAVSVYNFIVFLQFFFPGGLSLQRTLYAIAIITSLYPLFRLHKNQRREPRQPPATGWYRSIAQLISRAFHPERQDPDTWLDEGPGDGYAQTFVMIWNSFISISAFSSRPRPTTTDFSPNLEPYSLLRASHVSFALIQRDCTVFGGEKPKLCGCWIAISDGWRQLYLLPSANLAMRNTILIA
jgi:hypothetical protein